MKETLLPRGFLPPPRTGSRNRTNHSPRRHRALRSHSESLDSNHRLSPRSLHKTMSGPGGTGHSGRPGPPSPELANSAPFGGDGKVPRPSGAMKRGALTSAKPKSAPPSAHAGMDGGFDQWIMCRGLVCGVGGVHQYDAGDIRDDSGFIEQGQDTSEGLGVRGTM